MSSGIEQVRGGGGKILSTRVLRGRREDRYWGKLRAGAVTCLSSVRCNMNEAAIFLAALFALGMMALGLALFVKGARENDASSRMPDRPRSPGLSYFAAGPCFSQASRITCLVLGHSTRSIASATGQNLASTASSPATGSPSSQRAA